MKERKSDDMKTVTDFLNLNIDDDVITEADEPSLPTEGTGGPDSLVEDVTPELNENESIETAPPMESIPENGADEVPPEPNDEGEDNHEIIMPDPNEAPDAKEKDKPAADAPIEDTPYDEIEDDGDKFDPSVLDTKKEEPVPDTTPGPDDKDQGNFEGPMKYVPLYQRREEGSLEGFGEDRYGDTPNNQYDMKEVNSINVLISSEASAVGEYTTAAKESKNHTLQRLYSDIANEERFHLEQLMYAKSQITGEIYIPHDPAIKDEYKELIAMGMDEETAMTTAVDKVGLMPREVSDEDMMEAAEDVLAMKEYFLSVLQSTNMVLEQLDDNGLKADASATIQEAYNELMGIDNEYVMEAMASSHNEKPFNPIKFIGSLITKIYTAILGFIKKFKMYINKMYTWNRKTMDWIKANGIKGLFADGIYLYCYNEKLASVDFPVIGQFLELAMNVTEKICEKCQVTEFSNKYDIGRQLRTSFQTVPFKTIEEGADKLKTTLLSKTKLIVTERNEDSIEALFFGMSKHKLVGIDTNGKKVRKSDNIHNQYEIALDISSVIIGAIKQAATALENLEKNTQSVFYTNRTEVYDPCMKSMMAVVKAVQKLESCLVADTQEIMTLNTKLLKMTQQGDAAGYNRLADSNGKPIMSADDVRGNAATNIDARGINYSGGRVRLIEK